MLWIALATPSDSPAPPTHESPSGPDESQALGRWALQFSPRVCVFEEAVLAEVAASARLFGGQRALLERVRAGCREQQVARMAVAPTSLAALALLRHLAATSSAAEEGAQLVPVAACTPRNLTALLDSFPLAVLSATLPHAGTLQRLGCHTLGQLRQLPRGGLSRRFGAALLDALDRAYGLKTETYPWLVLPEHFDQRLEFNGRVELAAGLIFGAQRLLGQLAAWLQGRQSGVTALRLHWTHDLVRRGELGTGAIELRTAEASRDTAHLGRLLAEHLARTVLAAPVVAIRLEALEVEPLPTASSSLLPEDRAIGESFSQLVERLSARLGADRVLCGRLEADHRPQRMQSWAPATAGAAVSARAALMLPGRVALQPPWLLAQPLRLATKQDRPMYQGPLMLLAGPERLEAGWWPQPAANAAAAATEDDGPSLRDYFVARSPHAGLLWVYRDRATTEPAWYLHGVYG